jgi:arabinose-5-phosphate isomerase
MDSRLATAREVFDIEIEALTHLRDQLGDDFLSLAERCHEILNNGGKLVLTGIGKSGYIAQKIAATLSSVGSTAVFLHPVEALHGDLGIVCQKDMLLAISYSGETDELLAVLPGAKRLGVFMVAVTGDPDSQLSRFCDMTLNMAVPREACPFNLAPTATTTALLALGDALAMVLLRLHGFTKEDYGRFHPGGAIGRSVTLLVKEIMRSGDSIVLVSPDCTVKTSLLKMTKARCGAAIVVDEDSRLLGIFTDGDFRRHIEKSVAVIDRPVGEIMTPNPANVRADELAVEVLKLIEAKKINDVVAVDNEGRVVGLVDVQDLPGLKLM